MNTLLMFLQLLPGLIVAIKAIEEALPGTGRGEEKIAMLRGFLETVDSGVKENWPIINKVVGFLVPLLTKKA